MPDPIADAFAALLQESVPAFGVWRLFLADWESFGSVFQQSSFLPMHRSLHKNTGNAHFCSQIMLHNAEFSFKMYNKFQGCEL